MRRKTLYSLVAVLLMAAAPVLRAQDTTSVSILGLTMQERYKPYNQPFHRGGAFANTYITVLGSGYRQFASNYSNGPHLAVGFEKWVNPFHAVRITAGAGYFYDNVPNTALKFFDLRASYLFNVTNYVNGYKPMRVVEVMPIAGLGANFYFASQGKLSAGLTAHLGADIVMRIFPGVDLVVEPLLELSQDARKLTRMDVWRNYLLGWHMGVGARFALDKERRGADPGKNWFVTVQGGAQLQNSALERTISLGNALGITGSVGVGRYYGKAFALRLQGGYGFHYWKEIKEGDTDIYGMRLQYGRFRSSYYSLRLDGMMDFVALFSQNESRWSASLLAGPEVGLLIKQDPSPEHTDIRYWYVGASAGVQAKYRIWRGLGVFLEPRASLVPYTADAYMSSTKNRNYYDAVFAVSLGLEYEFGRK